MISTKKKTIHVFGNPLLDYDSLPLKFVPKLKKHFPEINFVIADPNENIKPTDGEMIIMDTVEELEKAAFFDDLDKIQTKKSYSLHDFDLGFNLKLLKKIGKLRKIKIIGVPMDGNEKTLLMQVAKLILANI